MKKIGVGFFFAVLFSFSANTQTIFSWTPGVDPGWISSDGVLRWRNGCSAVTTNCAGNYLNFTDSFYFSGPLNTTCTTASTVIPTIDIAGSAEFGWDFLYMYYSYDGVNWTNILGPNVGLTGNAGAGVTWSYPAIATGTTVYFLFNFVSDGSFTDSGYRLSNFTVDCNVVLPVELTALDAEYNGDVNVIKWTTESEINNSHFTVERTTDGVNFGVVKVEEGRGNSDIQTNYEVVDQKFEKGKINYYRLTQVDFDGKEETFDMVSVDNREVEAEVLKTVNLFGQVVTEDYKGIVIDYYNDGSTKKRYQP